MNQPLQGRIVALAEGRQQQELADLLAREGAIPFCCPMVSMLDAPDPAPVLAWIDELRAERFSHVILLTGEGLRRLLGFAERAGQRDGAIAALAKSRIVTRGPKPVRALREVGLAPSIVAGMPTSAGVIESLRNEPLRGWTVGVQLYAPDNPPLLEFLQTAGATVRTVLPYIYAPATDAERVVELIERLARGEFDVLIFTSSPQVDRLFEVAGTRGLQAQLEEGMKRVRVAAVGPIVADNLRRRGAPVDISPGQGFVMKNLVQQICRTLSAG